MASTTIRTIKGSIAFITGAASGLGKGTLLRFCREGVRGVVAFDKQKLILEDEEIRSLKNVVTIQGDTTDEDAVKNAIDRCEETFGRLDTVVNCAGIGVAFKSYNFAKKNPHSLRSFKDVMEYNTMGTFNVNRLAVGLIAKNERVDDLRGVLINTASTAAFDGQVGQVAYAASNAGIVGMTLPMARDFSTEGIRVVTIAPGIFSTPLVNSLPDIVKNYLVTIIPCPYRMGFPDEFAHLVQAIVENPIINGTVIRIDGGLRMPP